MNKSTLVKKHKDNSLETVPYILSRISAGFPSPADDYIENNLSISEPVSYTHLTLPTKA